MRPSKEALTPEKALLSEIAAEMARPRPNQSKLAKLNKQLDKVLGTSLQEEDYGALEDYERNRGE